MTPLLSAVQQLLEQVEQVADAGRAVVEPVKRQLERIDGKISRQLTQMRKDAEHRDRTLNALLLQMASIHRLLGIDPTERTIDPNYQN
jgi:hypothetical protein